MAWVTILTPLFNGIEYFDECYKSIVEQTETNWSWKIGINGHGDDTNPIYTSLKSMIKDPRIHVVNYLTLGKVDTLNEMVKDVSSNYIALIDCDDMWLPTKLEIQKKILEDHVYIDVLGTNCYYIGDLNGSPNLPYGMIDFPTLLKINPIVNSSIIMKRELAVWENRFHLEDYDLWLRLSLEKKKLITIPQPFIYHRVYSTSAYNNSGLQNPTALLQYYMDKVKDITVVSAYFPINSKNSVKEYLDWVNVWKDIPCNLVFFTTLELVPYIENLRKEYINKTKIIHMAFTEFEAFKRYGTDFWITQKLKDHEQYHTPELYVLWYEKKEFVKKAIALDPFKTTKFLWCDAGICRNKDWIPVLKNFPRSDKVPEDTFLVLRITDFENHDDYQYSNCVGGGILAGSKKVWESYYNKYDSMIQNYLENNKFIGKDQSIIASMIKKEPEFFTTQSVIPEFSGNGYMCWFSLLFDLS